MRIQRRMGFQLCIMDSKRKWPAHRCSGPKEGRRRIVFPDTILRDFPPPSILIISGGTQKKNLHPSRMQADGKPKDFCHPPHRS